MAKQKDNKKIIIIAAATTLLVCACCMCCGVAYALVYFDSNIRKDFEYNYSWELESEGDERDTEKENDSDDDGKDDDDTEDKNQQQNPECPYYQTEEQYLTEAEYKEYFDNQLENSTRHFRFEFIEGPYTLDLEERDFILANLENQYCRYIELYDHEFDHKIDVSLDHEVDRFVEMSGNQQIFAAYANYSELIELYSSKDPPQSDRYKASVLSHELTHIFIYDIQGYYIEIWLNEGMAESLSEPEEWYSWWIDSDGDLDSKIAILKDDLKANTDITEIGSLIVSEDVNEYTVGYDIAHVFCMYLIEEFGEETVMEYYTEVSWDTKNNRFEYYFGEELEVFYEDWVESL